jgi:hypothetical protein
LNTIQQIQLVTTSACRVLYSAVFFSIILYSRVSSLDGLPLEPMHPVVTFRWCIPGLGAMQVMGIPPSWIRHQSRCSYTWALHSFLPALKIVNRACQASNQIYATLAPGGSAHNNGIFESITCHEPQPRKRKHEKRGCTDDRRRSAKVARSLQDGAPIRHQFIVQSYSHILLSQSRSRGEDGISMCQRHR